MSVLDAERFDSLVARLVSSAAPTPPAPPAPASSDDPVDLLVHSFLLWETTPVVADRAAKKLKSAFVDLNELRVARTDEIVSVIGVRCPRAEERSSLLRRSLNDIFNREHAVTLANLIQRHKRDAKQYLTSLDGCPQYVSARVLVLGFGAHAAPLDAFIHARLAQAGVFTEPVDLERAASLLERHIRADDSLATHLALESLRDEALATPPGAAASRRRATSGAPSRPGKKAQ